MPDKYFRPLLVILLAALLAIQVYELIPKPAPVVSIPQDCVTAAAGLDARLSIGVPSLADYQDAAYSEAENINQQIFFANEFIFTTLHSYAELQQAVIEWQITCE